MVLEEMDSDRVENHAMQALMCEKTLCIMLTVRTSLKRHKEKALRRAWSGGCNEFQSTEREISQPDPVGRNSKNLKCTINKFPIVIRKIDFLLSYFHFKQRLGV
jgi:hypothetical protein